LIDGREHLSYISTVDARFSPLYIVHNLLWQSVGINSISGKLLV
jgi:hypothetical protein